MPAKLDPSMIQPDGGLYDTSHDASHDYLKWKPGDDTATLDGDFTADELEAIADHMRRHSRGPRG